MMENQQLLHCPYQTASYGRFLPGPALAVVMVLLLLSVIVFFPSTSSAVVQGLCSNCHTMHDSQNALSVTGSGPIAVLLNSDCLGCHTGNNTATTIDVNAVGEAPFVMGIAAPTYGASGTEAGHSNLAGGDFYWLDAGDDRKGHNVTGMGAGADTPHGNSPPGGDAVLVSQLTCAGTYGCHGDRTEENEYLAMSGGHHARASAVVSGYRLLDGIDGLEDSDWEYTVAYNDHNQYLGRVRTDDDQNGSPTTISELCVICHDYFHSGSGSGQGTVETDANFGSDPWIRHPVDYDLNGLGGEFANYNDEVDATNKYSVKVPLASTSVAAVKSNVLAGAGDAIVMCLSCHRAHGSPNDYSLRWDYKHWPDTGSYPNAYNGCAVCHTTKD